VYPKVCAYTPIIPHLKAFEKSQNTIQLNSLFSSEFKIVLYNSINWWTVECLGKKPKNYLHERKQKVVIRDSSSSLSNVFAGVPQGCMLGPLLFLIYINDIGEQLLSLTRLFADDTSLGYLSSSPDTLELVINHYLNKLSTWYFHIWTDHYFRFVWIKWHEPLSRPSTKFI
jgi:hypothetical protein